MAQVLSSFFWGYIFTQFLGARLSAQYGGQRVLLWALCGWSTMTIATPGLCRTSVQAAAVGRALLGLFEGTTFPCIFAIISPMVPSDERGGMLARLNISASVGTIAAFAICPFLVETAGWASMFYIFGSFGFVVCALWVHYGSKHRINGLAAGELGKRDGVTQRVASDTAVGSRTTQTALRYLGHPAVVAICTSHFCNNFGDAMVLSWLPTVMSTRFGVHGTWLSLSSLPYIARIGGAAFGGAYSDRLLNRFGSSTTSARAWLVTTGFTVAAVALGLLGSVSTAALAIGLFSVERFATAAGSVGGYEAAKLDIASGSDAALLQALANSIAAVASLCGAQAISVIVAAGGGWDDALRCAALLYICSVVSYARWGDSSISVAAHRSGFL